MIEKAEPVRLAATIRGLLADPGRCREMGRRGRSWVLETLDPRRVIDRYEELYGSLCEAPPG